MKKVFLLSFILASVSAIQACEICGVNNFYIGVLPQFNHKFLGVRYHFNSFNTRLADDATQYSKDFYQTVELWGGWNVSKKVQLFTFVPFSHNHQNSDEGISKRSGLGDIVLLANYKVLDINSVSSSDKVLSQQLWIGGGVKLKTGKFKIDSNDSDVGSSANGQLGSGSTDILLNAMYNVRIQKLGINTTATYKVSSTNNDQYRFGDKVTASSFLFYPLLVSKSIINPNLGLIFERTSPGELENTKMALTGGSILLGSGGVDLSFNKVAVGFNAQLPLAQDFAENQTRAKVKGTAHISFAF
ncbi:MAG TPA: hypothetical protein VFP87_06875 [Chitinophagaceae bacterium]|nr:hypothetical protein [Chitinophagaceae bacterium]